VRWNNIVDTLFSFNDVVFRTWRKIRKSHISPSDVLTEFVNISICCAATISPILFVRFNDVVCRTRRKIRKSRISLGVGLTEFVNISMCCEQQRIVANNLLEKVVLTPFRAETISPIHRFVLATSSAELGEKSENRTFRPATCWQSMSIFRCVVLQQYRRYFLFVLTTSFAELDEKSENRAFRSVSSWQSSSIFRCVVISKKS